MKVNIKSPIVRENVELFKKLLGKLASKKGKASEVSEFAAYVNCVTGKISFADFAKGNDLKNRQWKPIQITMRISETGKEVAFEVVEEGKNPVFFNYNDLEPLARRTVADTIHTLNSIAKQIQKSPDLEKVYKEISSLEIDVPSIGPQGKDIVHEAWHQVDRIKAEELLEAMPIGTFLFRKDSFCEILEGQLAKNLEAPIKCLTLSFLESKDKVSDHTLVKKEEGWVVYNDDPSLNERVYPTIYDLLEAYKDKLKFPLLQRNHPE